MNKKTFEIRSLKKRGSNMQTLLLGGDLSTRNAARIKKKLDTVKFSGDTISIHLNNVDNLDITIIQMLYSLINSFISQGKNTKIIPELPEDLEKVVANAGFRELIKHKTKNHK